MEMTVYNPQKGRLETIYIKVTDKNTTWFDNCVDVRDIHMITDVEGSLLIREFGCLYPFLIYDTSRADIGYSQQNALELKRLYE